MVNEESAEIFVSCHFPLTFNFTILSIYIKEHEVAIK